MSGVEPISFVPKTNALPIKLHAVYEEKGEVNKRGKVMKNVFKVGFEPTISFFSGKRFNH